MKPPSKDHDLIRWLDGEMNTNEHTAFEERLRQDPALAQEAQELRALSAGIRSHLPADMPVPHADFFNSQIQVRIAQMEMDAERAKPAAAPGWAKLLQWLRQPWLTSAGAVALAVIAFVLLRPEATANSFILSSYTPNTSVHAHTFHDDAADATVLMLDGLDAIPADRKISGINNVHRSVSEPQFATTALYDAAGERLLVISRDAVGNPLIWAKNPRG
jgi:anti-sigma factor RsiW